MIDTYVIRDGDGLYLVVDMANAKVVSPPAYETRAGMAVVAEIDPLHVLADDNAGLADGGRSVPVDLDVLYARNKVKMDARG